MGKKNRSAIGTLVERTSGYVCLVHLPGGHTAEELSSALIDIVDTLPRHLWRSLTWDQGSEMACHGDFTAATGLPVYFCDPASPWQRPTNENTNGLLRQYFPKGDDLRRFSPDDLAFVALEVNQRPRKRLDWESPAEMIATLLTSHP